MTPPLFILLASLLLQCTAFGVVLNMIRVTGKKLAWLLLAAAILLMVVRRAISLTRMLTEPAYNVDMTAELVALTISVLLLLGLDRIRPVFRSIKKSTEELLNSREVIAANEEKYRALVDMMTSIVWTTDTEGRFVTSQQSWENYTGQTLEQYKNFGWLDAIHADDRDRIQKIWTTAVRERRIYGAQGRIWHQQSGKYRYFVSRAAPLLNPDGTVREWIGKITDVHDRREAEEALRLNEERLKFAVQATTDGVWDWNIESGEVYFNPRWLNSLGYDEGDLKPTISSWEEIIHPDDRPAVMNALYNHLENRTPYFEIENRLRMKNGNYRWNYERGRVVVRDKLGMPLRMVGMDTDISQRKAVEEIRRKFEIEREQLLQRLQTIMDRMPVACITLDSQFRFSFWNSAAESLFGYSYEEVKGKSAEGIITPPEASLTLKTLIEQSEPDGSAVNETIENITKQGQIFIGEWNNTPLHNMDGSFSGVVCMCRDVTEQQRAQHLLKESEERLDLALAASVEGHWDWDLERGEIYFSKHWYESLGYSQDEIPGTWDAIKQLIHPDDVVNVIARLEAHLEGRTPHYECDNRLRTKSGEWRWNHSRAKVVAWKGNKPLRMVGTDMDITQRKEAELSLQALQKKYKELYESAPEMLLSIDAKSHCIIQCNQATLAKLGYPRHELIGKHIMGLYHPDSVDKAKRTFQHFLETGQIADVELRIVKKSGDIIDILLTASAVRDENGNILHTNSIWRDISERKRMEAILRRNETLLRTFVEYTPAAVAMFDNQMRYVVASRRWLQDYNLGDIQIIGRSHYEIFPEITEQWKEIHRRCLAGAIEKCDEDRFVRANGSIDWVRWEVHPWTTIDDKIGGIIMFTEVITERRQAAEARERLVEELEAKNSQLEQFTYTVSHDLKTPLITIRGFAGAIEDDLRSGNSDRMQSDLKQIANAAERMQQLLDDLLDLSRIGHTANPSDVVSFDQLIEEALLLTAGRILESRMDVVVRPSSVLLRIDRARMTEAVVNLIDNAAKFGGENPRIEIGCTDIGRQWMVYIEDNGIGIESQYHDKIFGLFDRLDPNIEGTGIGLTLVKRIIEVHGGKIWVESEGRGRGSRFCFTLPKLHETAEVKEKEYDTETVNHIAG